MHLRLRRWIDWRLLITAVAATACSPRFQVDDPACDAPFLDWTGGITHYALQGDGHGAFDYDPPGVVSTRLWGELDWRSDRFWWKETYAADSWLGLTTVDGTGEVDTNGDLDVSMVWAESDYRELGWVADVRLTRVGCDEWARWDWRGGGRDEVETTYGGDAVEALRTWQVGDSAFETLRVTNRDLTFTEQGSGDALDFDSTWTVTGDEGDGTSTETFLTTYDSGEVNDGTVDRFRDGGEAWDFVYTDPQGTAFHWVYEVSYEGAGTGTLTWDEESCEVRYWDWDCTLDCTDGYQGPC